DAGAREPLAGARIEHRAAPGGDDDAFPRRKLREAVPFPVPEAGLPFLLEDERNVDAGTLLDLRVAVAKLPPERLRELASDGRLAGPHRPDEVDVRGGAQGAPSR